MRLSTRPLLWLLVLLSATLSWGCSGGDRNSSVTFGDPTIGNPVAQTSNVNFTFQLLRAVPANVDFIEFVGLDSNNTLLYGPVTRAKAATITLTDVPIAVTTIRIRYLANGVLVGEGSVTVNLTAGGDTTINDPDFTEFTAQSITVAPADSTIGVNSTVQLSATQTLSNNSTTDVTASVTWTSSNAAIASVSASGLVTGISAGQVVINAAGQGVTGSAVVRVVAGAGETSLAVMPTSVNLVGNFTQQLTAVSTLGDGSSLDVTTDSGTSYTSSNSTVATVSTSGLVTAVNPGSSTVTVTRGSLTATSAVTVANATLQTIAISPLNATVQVGQSTSFTVTGTFSDGQNRNVTSSATFTSSNTAVATVSGNSASGVSAGNSTITATVGAQNATASLTVTAAGGGGGTGGLGRLNALRALAGLNPVTENAQFSADALLHSTYMVKNDVITHSEDPNLPFFTAAGDTSARNSNLSITSNINQTIEGAIDGLMAAPFHGIGFIDPRLAQSGFGHYTEAIGTFRAGSTVNVLQGLGPVPGGTTFPILWPGDGQTMPYSAFTGNEFPDPLTSLSGFSAPTGAPLYVQYGSGSATINVTNVTLTDNSNGSSVQVGSFDETNYSNPDPSTQALGRAVLATRDCVVIMPRSPLVAGRNYTCSITNNGTTTTWSFTVATSPPFRAAPSSDTTLIR